MISSPELVEFPCHTGTRSPLMPVVCMGGNLSRVRLMPVSWCADRDQKICRFRSFPGHSQMNCRNWDLGMDQYLLISFLGGWTSINPSYFDVNYRGTRFWHCHMVQFWGISHFQRETDEDKSAIQLALTVFFFSFQLVDSYNFPWIDIISPNKSVKRLDSLSWLNLGLVNSNS